MSSENEIIDAELVEEETSSAVAVTQPHALESLTRAEVDVMIERADRKPRPEIEKIRKAMLSIAKLNADVAASCFYTLKRKDKEGKTVKIEGPSVRLAEIALACYKNIRAGSRVIDNDGRKITAQGVAFDVEANVMVSTEVSRRIVTKTGRTYSEDMQIVTANAACAIARRNAIFEVIPRALVDSVYEEVKKVALGTDKTLEERRQSVLGRFGAMGVTREQILRMLGKETVEAIDLEALDLLIGLGTAIKDGMTTIDEVFEPTEAEKEDPNRKLTLRELARKAAEAKETAKKTEKTK